MIRFSDSLNRAPRKGVLFLFLFLCFFFITAEEPKALLDKTSFVSMFVNNSDAIKSYKEKVFQAEADYDKASSQMFPKIKVVLGTGPHPRYVYDDESNSWHKSENLNDADEWGLAIRAKGEITQPLYTFGKISNAQDAALSGIEVVKAQKEIAALKMKKEAASFYYSYLMSIEMKEKLEGIISDLNDAETKLNEWLYEEKEDVSQKDLIKLKLEKEKILYEYDKLNYSIETLKEVVAAVAGNNWEIKETSLQMVDFSYTFDELLAHLVGRSAYEKYMKNGVLALTSLYELEKSKMFPDLGISGFYEYKYTSSVSNDTATPYADSPYNGTTGEIGLGLQINLNFVEQWSRVKKAKAELRSAEYEAGFAKTSAVIKLREKFNAVFIAKSQIEHLKKSYKLSKGWMTVELANYKSGFGKSTDLIEAVKKFSENDFALLNAYYDYNMKVEEIKLFTGLE